MPARGDFADVSRPSAPPFVSLVREDVNVIGAIASREDSKARIKAARYTTAKISEANTSETRIADCVKTMEYSSLLICDN